MNALARRQWLNGGLLGLAGGLAALALFELDRERSAEISPLLDLAPARIERIVVERTGQETLAFKRRTGRWWMTAPTAGLANPVLLDPILHLAEARCLLRYTADELDLKASRLDPPQLRLHLNDREIRFGTTAPTDGQRYLQIGNTIHLCPDGLYPLLTSAAGSFLGKPLNTMAPESK
ncbi:MAG TPA: hypothetical protein PKY50_16910 [Candidatus Competibacter sp.]|nr:hypothetical protein [Candidatus Competibacter sp.]